MACFRIFSDTTSCTFTPVFELVLASRILLSASPSKVKAQTRTLAEGKQDRWLRELYLEISIWLRPIAPSSPFLSKICLAFQKQRRTSSPAPSTFSKKILLALLSDEYFEMKCSSPGLWHIAANRPTTLPYGTG